MAEEPLFFAINSNNTDAPLLGDSSSGGWWQWRRQRSIIATRTDVLNLWGVAASLLAFLYSLWPADSSVVAYLLGALLITVAWGHRLCSNRPSDLCFPLVLTLSYLYVAVHHAVFARHTDVWYLYFFQCLLMYAHSYVVTHNRYLNDLEDAESFWTGSWTPGTASEAHTHMFRFTHDDHVDLMMNDLLEKEEPSRP